MINLHELCCRAGNQTGTLDLQTDTLQTVLWTPAFVNPCPAERIYPAFANSVDPDQLASEEAN